MDKEDSYTGLFRYAYSAKFINIKIENVEINQGTSSSSAGALAGYMSNTVSQNIRLKDITISCVQYGGGLVGYFNQGSLIDCFISGHVVING